MSEKLASIKKSGKGSGLMCATGTFTRTDGTLCTVDVGFRPRKVCAVFANPNTMSSATVNRMVVVYDEDLSNTRIIRALYQDTEQCRTQDISAGNPTFNITDNGFTMNFNSASSWTSGTWYYTAIE